MRKTVAIAISFILIMLIVTPTKASFSKVIEDDKGDVISVLTNGTTSKPDVDIKKLTYYQYDNGRVVLSLQVYGEIDPNSEYWILLSTSDGKENATYLITYTQNPVLLENESSESVLVMKGDIDKVLDNSTFEEINKDTLRVTFYLLSPKESLTGIEAITFCGEQMSGEWIPLYMDELNYTTEQSQSQQNQNQNGGDQGGGQNNEGGEKKSPGFEIIILLAAVFISALILIRKKKL